MTPVAGAARVSSTPDASTLRGTWSGADSALSAMVCQDVSPGRGARRGLSARNAPEPGRVTTNPSAASSASALETVTGLTR